jgi:AGZA family xanthine/uracil permease-like MFS transporter
LFFLVSISGLRKKIINAIPQGLKFAVGAGIGFFITFIGLTNAGIIVADGATFVQLGDLSHPTVLLGVFGIVMVVILYSMGNKFSLIIAIAVTAIVGMILGALGVDMMPAYSTGGMEGLFSGAKETTFAAFSGFGELFNHPEVFGIIFALWFVDFFDTAGTLMAVGNQAGLIDENGELVGSDRALIADSIGTMSGALLGTSNVTSYIESATGIEQGGRTGLSSVTVAVLFILSLLIYPLLSIVNGVVVGFNDFGDAIVYSPVTSMALVMVGALMISQLKELDWNKKEIVVPSFLTIVFMILTYSIATGIAVGFIFYPIIMIAQKRWREVNPMMYILSLLFLIAFVTGSL